MSLAVVLCAFHHIRYNNKHNNVGGEGEYFKKDQIAPKLMSDDMTASVQIWINVSASEK